MCCAIRVSYVLVRLTTPSRSYSLSGQVASPTKESRIMNKPEGVLGVDYAEASVGDFSELLGCLILGDLETIHLGQLFSRITACGKPMGDTLLSKHFYITCKECVAEIVYRDKNSEARQKPFGEVTHE